MLKTFVKLHVSKDVGILPFYFASLNTIPHEEAIIRDSLAYSPDFVSIEDREYWLKRFRGTQGKNINKIYYNDSLEED